ncbi:pinin-like isoform X2 [Antechinus flavipes]|uniref:pinin-like isoform X2 n=1 Tax=Antechinus flavipes TaxID=38775 RepID=UPI0022364374|nr:pinin-like isoform X2 [Antechinus flavipes]
MGEKEWSKDMKLLSGRIHEKTCWICRCEKQKNFRFLWDLFLSSSGMVITFIFFLAFSETPQTTAQEEATKMEEKTSSIPSPKNATETSPKERHDVQDPDCFKYIPHASTYSFIIYTVVFDIFGIAHIRKGYNVQNVSEAAQTSRNNYINMCFQITPQKTGNVNSRAPVNQEAYYGFLMDNFQLTRAEEDCFQEQVRNTLNNNFYPRPHPQNNFYPRPHPQNNFYPRPHPQNNFYPRPHPQNNFYPRPHPQNNFIYPHPQPQNNYFNLYSPEECFRKVNYGFVNLPFTTQSNHHACSICSHF